MLKVRPREQPQTDVKPIQPCGAVIDRIEAWKSPLGERGEPSARERKPWQVIYKVVCKSESHSRSCALMRRCLFEMNVRGRCRRLYTPGKCRIGLIVFSFWSSLSVWKCTTPNIKIPKLNSAQKFR